ncbi:MAG TPA: metalloregulator ArsR/SmtB family transcription factor [Candidatus Moranbacteria bacterium]|nr:metalloregulator ArsR/SmtB family transcription factor [Candidatus Moranbacteria bacterium]
MKKSSKKSKKDKIQAKDFVRINRFLKSISDKNRLRIILGLKGTVMNVTELHTSLGLPQNLTSHHISKLKELNLLTEKSEGTFRRYTVNLKKMKEYENMLKKTLFC